MGVDADAVAQCGAVLAGALAFVAALSHATGATTCAAMLRIDVDVDAILTTELPRAAISDALAFFAEEPNLAGVPTSTTVQRIGADIDAGIGAFGVSDRAICFGALASVAAMACAAGLAASAAVFGIFLGVDAEPIAGRHVGRAAALTVVADLAGGAGIIAPATVSDIRLQRHASVATAGVSRWSCAQGAGAGDTHASRRTDVAARAAVAVVKLGVDAAAFAIGAAAEGLTLRTDALPLLTGQTGPLACGVIVDVAVAVVVFAIAHFWCRWRAARARRGSISGSGVSGDRRIGR